LERRHGERELRCDRILSRGCTVAHLGDAAVAALTPLYQESRPVAWHVSFAVTDADAAARKATDGTVDAGPERAEAFYTTVSVGTWTAPTSAAW